jgi:hypothetical protein
MECRPSRTLPNSAMLILSEFALRLEFPGPNSKPLCTQGQSQSHIATDGQPVSKSWCRAPSGAHDEIFITV